MSNPVEGSILRAAAVLGTEPELTLYTVENGTLRFIGGFEYEVLSYLTAALNLSVIAVNASNYAASAPTKNNSTNIDVGTMIKSDLVDLCFSVHEFNIHRATTLSYLHPTFTMKLFGYFVEQPRSSTTNIYLQPFHNEMWLATLCAWTFIVTTAIIIIWVKKNVTLELGEKESSISRDVLLWAISTGCQQGWMYCPESTSLKIVFFCGLLLGVIIYSAYSAVLISLLSLTVPLNKLSDIISAKYEFFASNLFPAAELFIKQKEFLGSAATEGNVISPPEGVANVLNRPAIFLDFDEEFIPLMMKKLSNVEICSKISKIDLNSAPYKTAMLVKKNSRFKNDLNKKILWMMNTGLLHRAKINYRDKTILSCLPKPRHNKNSLNFNDILPALLIFFFLDAISLLCFILEKYFNTIAKLN